MERRDDTAMVKKGILFSKNQLSDRPHLQGVR